MKNVDVAIIGGGLAGSLLARQLRRQSPHLSVALFERDRERSFKVGESTVEIATSYLTRRLGLSTYLYHHHLPKNGLRFFFDDAAKQTPLEEMSEIGLAGLPTYPSFQLDRARLEADLLEMNAEDGVDVHVGARVTGLTLAPAEASAGTTPKHTFQVREDDADSAWSARWVVDASGRGGVLGRQLELRVPERGHRVAAAWGRFEGVRDMDDWAAPEWLARARHTTRALSTNHFCYAGYWIWFIPLRGGVTSVGIVADAAQWNRACHEPEGFQEKLREHRAVADLLEEAGLVDHGAFAQLAFRTRRFFGDARWAVVGDAAAFVDPFYSPGSDFIALENDMVADLIARETAGEAMGERTEAYDAFLKLRFDAAMLLYEGLYETFGSYEIMRAKVFFDCACYYNLWFDTYARDEHLDLRKVRGTLRRQRPVLTAMRNMAQAFTDASRSLTTHGHYHRQNRGIGLHDGQDAFGPIADVGAKRRRPIVDRRSEEVFNRTLELLTQAVRGEDAPYVPRPMWEMADEGVAFLNGVGAH
ncbi:MAG: NAD(P)/FAD-dependent oxidoreductase [Myxococcota bacterium]